MPSSDMDNEVVRLRLMELDIDVAHSSLSDDDSDDSHEDVLLPPGEVPRPLLLIKAVVDH